VKFECTEWFRGPGLKNPPVFTMPCGFFVLETNEMSKNNCSIPQSWRTCQVLKKNLDNDAILDGSAMNGILKIEFSNFVQLAKPVSRTAELLDKYSGIASKPGESERYTRLWQCTFLLCMRDYGQKSETTRRWRETTNLRDGHPN